MTPLQTLVGQTILIVDGVSVAAAELADRLTALGAKVHVVGNAISGERFVSAKKFDVALLGYDGADIGRDLFRALEKRGVPYVQCASTSKVGKIPYDRIFSLPLTGAIAA